MKKLTATSAATVPPFGQTFPCAQVAADGIEALKASEDNGAFDLLVTDIALPQMRGTELAQRLIERQPQLRVLYMSGYSEEKVSSDIAHFIPKPFRREALIHKIREVLDSEV